MDQLDKLRTSEGVERRNSSLADIEGWLDKCSNEEPDSIIYDPDFVQDVASSRAKGQMEYIQKLYTCIVDNCTKIGLSPEQCESRVNDLETCLDTFLKSVDQDLQEEFDRLCRYKQGLLDRVQKTLKDLNLPPYVDESDHTLLQGCKRLKDKFAELSLVKNERMSKLEFLKSKQLGLCLTLGIEAPQVRLHTDIPSQDELNSLTEALIALEIEVSRRKEKYDVIKQLIENCMNELEYEPEDDFERNVLDEKPCYKDSHLLKLNLLHSKLEARITLQREKFDSLKDQLKSLYNRMDVPIEEQDDFFSTHASSKPSIMLEMELEIEHYMELKKQNITKFIDKIKEELEMEYDRCFISQEQQDAFFSLSTVSGECDEELLAVYEEELERIKKFYLDNQKMLDKFQEWRQLWEKLIDFELKTNDPSRLYNRNCKLLEEEKERKLLQKNLPKVEKELKLLNEEYVKNAGKNFIVFDVNILDFMTGCWDELNHAKEQEKRERQRNKMRGNTLSATPAKRPPSATRAVAPKTLRIQQTVVKTAAKGSRIPKLNSGSSPSLVSPVSISEPEFESMIVNCTSSKKATK